VAPHSNDKVARALQAKKDEAEIRQTERGTWMEGMDEHAENASSSIMRICDVGSNNCISRHLQLEKENRSTIVTQGGIEIHLSEEH
jgi:hypothetical protein